MFLIPVALCILTLALFFHLRKKRNGWARLCWEFEDHTVLIFRWTALVTLFFAGFHKLNADFFTPGVSCEQVVKQYALRNWSLPGLEAALMLTSPSLIVAMESAVPIMLLFILPRIGVLTLTIFYAGIALTDALVVTLCIIIPALAFLKKKDWETLRREWKKPTLIWFGLVLGWLPFSAAHYLGSRPWLQPGLYQCLILLIISAVTWLVQADMLKAWKRRRSGQLNAFLHETLVAFGLGKPTLFSRVQPGATIVVVWCGVLILNCLSPYLGLKFNYSFAMLSNLRVDDARWNHFLIPKWARLTRYDGFIHVLFADVKGMNWMTTRQEQHTRGLKAGLFSPQAFHDTLDQLQEAGAKVELKLLVEYKGQAFDYIGTVVEPGFATFRAQLP